MLLHVRSGRRGSPLALLLPAKGSRRAPELVQALLGCLPVLWPGTGPALLTTAPERLVTAVAHAVLGGGAQDAGVGGAGVPNPRLVSTGAGGGATRSPRGL